MNEPDLSVLKQRVKERKPPTKDAKPGKFFPPEARAICWIVGGVWAKEQGVPIRQAVTQACACYWQLVTEAKK